MRKKKTYTVDQLNKMMMRDDLSLWEIIEACAFIDICDCYEPMFYPPKEQEDEWRRMRGEYEPEPTLENTSFYVTEPDGTKYFYCGNTRTKVTEFFSPNGQTMDELTLLGAPRKLVCQCCGMPLDDASISREPDGTFNEEYCKWCYADGKFVYTNLAELTDFLVAHMSNETWPPEQARAYFEAQLPKLNYWQQKK